MGEPGAIGAALDTREVGDGRRGFGCESQLHVRDE